MPTRVARVRRRSWLKGQSGQTVKAYCSTLPYWKESGSPSVERRWAPVAQLDCQGGRRRMIGGGTGSVELDSSRSESSNCGCPSAMGALRPRSGLLQG